MVQIEPTLYGLKVTFTGDLDALQLKNWLKQSKAALAGRQAGFHALVDLRATGPMTHEALVFWDIGLALYERQGMRESMVLLPDGRAVPMQQVVSRKAG